TGDHGEEFWEHEGIGHGRTLYDESVRVPLIMIAPGYRGGQRVEAAVSLLDVAPTLLDLLEPPPAPSFEGGSLLPLLESSSPAPPLPPPPGPRLPPARCVGGAPRVRPLESWSRASRAAGLRGRKSRQPPAADVIMELEYKE